MKQFLVFATLLFLFVGTADAKTMYVNDKIRITMRTGPGINHKVIAEPQSGQVVNVLDEDKGWSHVRLEDGKEGWVLTRFLTANQPKEIQLIALRESHEKLTEELETVNQENEQLKNQNEVLSLKTQETEAALESLTNAFETLKRESKDYLEVKQAYAETSAELEEHRKKSGNMESIIETLEWKQNVIFFLSGGLLFLIGFIIGSFNNRAARRRSSYL